VVARKDYYGELGVERDAGDEDLKRAYRKLAMKFHPDRTEGDKESEERFKEISEAYAVLSDPDKRAEYDRFGRVKDAFGGMDPMDGRTISDIFGDIFGDLFGGKRRSQASRGRDLRFNLTLEFDEAAMGTEKTISVPRKAACKACAGSGAAAGSAPLPCDTCRGAGQIRTQQGFFAVAQACPKCNGSGRIIHNKCKTCRGAGKTPTQERLTVRVPAGVEDGQRLRVPNKGEAGDFGGPAGHLIVVCQVASHPLFEREAGSKDLKCEIPVTLTEAVLGARVQVPTLDGSVRMKVPAGTQSGRVFRVAGKGIKPARGTAGDLLATLIVETPSDLGAEAKKLLRQFEDALPDGAYPDRDAFRDKLSSE
jgi:molecular chaperone DnaJ